MNSQERALLAAARAERAASAKTRFTKLNTSHKNLQPTPSVSTENASNTEQMDGKRLPSVVANSSATKNANKLRRNETVSAQPSEFIADNILTLTSASGKTDLDKFAEERRTRSSLYRTETPPVVKNKQLTRVIPLSATESEAALLDGDIRAAMGEETYKAYISALDCLIHPFSFHANDPDLKQETQALLMRLGVGHTEENISQKTVTGYSIEGFRQMHEIIAAINSTPNMDTIENERERMSSGNDELYFGMVEKDVEIAKVISNEDAQSVNKDEQVYRLSLSRFDDEILSSAPQMRAKKRNTLPLVSILFAEIVRLQCMVVLGNGGDVGQKFGETSVTISRHSPDLTDFKVGETADISGLNPENPESTEIRHSSDPNPCEGVCDKEQVTLELTKRFQVEVLAQVTAEGMVADTLSVSEEGDVKLGQADSYLAFCFRVPYSVHMKIRAQRKREFDDGKLLSALKRREKTLDKNTYYNKDTFVHKTAAFIRWEKDERQAIQLMLATQGSSPETPTTTTITPTTTAPAIITHGILSITLVKAREIMGRQGKNKSDPFCLFELSTGEQRHSTSQMKTSYPQWNEEFTYKIKARDTDKPFSLKVSVWNHGANAEEINTHHTITRGFRKYIDSDAFLGQLSIDEIRPVDYESPKEQWYELKKKSKRSSVSGEVLLRTHYMSPEHLRDQAAAEEKKVALAQDKEVPEAELPPFPDYHKLYTIMITTCLSRVQMRWKNRPQYSDTDTFIRPEWLSLLTDEFGLRYGVGRLYRVLTDLRITVDNYHQELTDVNMIHQRLQDVHELDRGDVRWTKQEVQLFAQVLSELDILFRGLLSSYKDYFPYSTPPGKLASYVDSLRLVEENVIFKKGAHDVSAVLQGCVRGYCQRTYIRYSAMSTPMSVRPTFEDFAVQISDLAGYITREIENDIMYFKQDFVNAATGKPLIAHMHLVTSTYMQLLNDEMAELLPQFTVEAPGVPGQDRLVVRPETTHQGRTYTKPTLQAFLHLRKFNDLCVSIQTEGGPDGTMPVVSFSPRFMSLFRGVVDGFLDWIKVEVDIWVQQAIVNDNFNPTSEDELHSTSCTDVFWSLSEVLTFLQGIQMGDKAHWSQSMETYVMVLCASVRHYISEISKIARHESLRLEEKAGAYMPSDVACTLINDFVMSARYLQIISGNLNIRTSALNEILDDAPLDPDEVNSGPDNFKSTGNSKANSFGLPGDQTRPSALDRQTSTISTTSAAQSLMHREMNQTSRMVALCLVGNIRMMGSRIVKPIRQIIQHIINKDSFFSSVKNLFSFGSSSGSTPDLSKSDGMIMVRTSSLPWQRKATTSTPLSAEVAEDMAPTLAYFDDVMSCAATRLYPHAVYLILEEMWVQVLQCAEDVLEAGDAKSELSLARLGESVMQLWEFFHADGQGLGIEVVQRPRIKTIQQVIQLLRAKDMEGLISMHSLFVRDAAARAFVSKTMKATGDRSVLDYLKSTGD